MIRFLFRFLATVSLAVAVVMAVLDATRSIAVSGVVLTPLGESWGGVAPTSLTAFQTMVSERLGAPAWSALEQSVLALPGFVVFAVLALLLYMIGHRPTPRGRLAAR